MTHHNTSDRREISEWQHTDDGLMLLLDERPSPVPHAITLLLLQGDRPLSESPVHDLLGLESTLRHMLSVFGAELLAAQRNVATARPESPPGRHRLPRRDGAFDIAVDHQGSTSRRHHTILRLLDELRRWLTSVEPTTGLLAEAVDGWTRGSEPPSSITAFADVDAFLAADPRRVTQRDWGGIGIDGVEAWGHGWRRGGEGDDPASFAPDGPNRNGYWSPGYCARTGEIYTVRRSPHLSDEVWLLGNLVRSRELADALLDPLRDHMRQPNSVVLAAQVVGDAAQNRAA